MHASVDSQRNRGAENGEEGRSSPTYQEIISTLPRGNGWQKLYDLYNYQGFWYYPQMLEGIMSVQQHFQPQPSDVLLCSCPKSGTTWLKALAFSIVTRASFDDSNSPLLSKMPQECVPCLECNLQSPASTRDPNIPLVSTHIPFSSLPTPIIDSGCKIVYICREPKDTFVSTYYFIKRYFASKNAEIVPLEEAFELFCDGVANCSPCWEHILGYWRASLERPGKILLLKYEDLRKNTAFYVKKLAEFMGYPFSAAEEETGVVEKIVRLCSFENMSNLEVNKSEKHRENSKLKIPNNIYFRKAKVGDWENHLSPEMAARIDSITEKKMKGSGLTL